MNSDDDKPPTPEEEAAARALAETLDGRTAEPGPPDQLDPADLEAVRDIRAAAGREPPLGELRARGIARAAVAAAREVRAVERVKPSATRARRWPFAVLSAAAALLVAVGTWTALGTLPGATASAPAHLYSRSAGRLVPGPFPSSQTAADRLDLVTTDRMVAFREVRARRLGGRR